jgi:MFS family permease
MLLWGAQIVSQLAFNMLNFVLLIQVFVLSSSNLAVSFLILSIGIPSIIFGLLAGVYVDRWNKKWVLVTTNLIRAAVVLGYLVHPNSLIWLYAVTFIVSSVTQFFAPAESSTIPAIVKPKTLVAANTLFLFTLYISFIAGYSIAGPLQHLFGTDFPFYLAAFAYAIATLFVLSLPSLPVKKRRVRLNLSQKTRNIFHELREGFNVIRANPLISRPILFLTLTQTLIGVIIVLMPAFSEEVLRISVRDASYILVLPAGAGMVVGAVFMTRSSHFKNRIRLIGWGIVASGVALAGVALTKGTKRLLHQEVIEAHSHLVHQGFLSLDRTLSLLAVVGTMVFILGFASSVVTITAQTILQEQTAERIRGRVFGTLNMLVNVAATLPILVAGILADLTSAVFVYLALSGLIMVWGVFELFRSGPKYLPHKSS